MPRWLRNILRHAACLVIVLAIAGIYRKLIPVNATTAALTFLLAVPLVAAGGGLAAGGPTPVGAGVSVDFFFLPPVRAVTTETPQKRGALRALSCPPSTPP